MAERPRKSTPRVALGGQCRGLPEAESELQVRVVIPGGWRLMGERPKELPERATLGGRCRGLPEAEKRSDGGTAGRVGNATLGAGWDGIETAGGSVGRGRPGRPEATGGKVGNAMLAAGPPLVTVTGLPVGTTSGKATVTPKPNPNPPGSCTDAPSVTPPGPPPTAADTPTFRPVGRAPPGSRPGMKFVMGATCPGRSVVSVSTFVTVEAIPPSVSVMTVVTSTGTTPSTG